MTGGGTGIGLACAKAIAARGASVMLAGRREEVVARAAAEIGANAAFVRCDVINDDSVEAAVGAPKAGVNMLTRCAACRSRDSARPSTSRRSSRSYSRTKRGGSPAK